MRIGSQKTSSIITMLVMVLIAATMWSSSVAQSDSAELGECWFDIANCWLEKADNDGSDPKLDPSSPSFDPKEALCCPLIKQTAETDKPCFCSISSLVDDPSVGSNITLILHFCETVPSDNSFDDFCAGTTLPANAPTTKVPLGKLPNLSVMKPKN